MQGNGMSLDPDLYESMRLELRRGSLVLAVLACLRTESQGLLNSEWREEERRKKRFYVLSPGGVSMLATLADEWRGINASLDKIL
jgi:hypothetical protein